VHIFLFKHHQSLELSENSLTENVICVIMMEVHEILHRLFEMMFTRPMIELSVSVMVRGSIGKEKNMMQNNVSNVRNAVAGQMGKKVKIRINRGRHKVDVSEGIISETYPSIFLIKIQETADMPVRTVSYSYTDILTKDVELILCH
jgi:uncharacterized protein Veg